MRYRIGFTFAALILSGLTVAGAAQRHPKPPARQKPAQKSPLDLRGSMTTFGSAVNFIIRDPKTFEHVWRHHDPSKSAPVVDFRRFDVVAVFAGQRSSAGYSVRIDAPQKSGKTANIPVYIVAPPRTAVTAQVITNPWAIKAVPKLPPDARLKLHQPNR